MFFPGLPGVGATRQRTSPFEYVVGIAQLVVAPDCGSGCRGFESHYPPQNVFGIGSDPNPEHVFSMGM